MKKMQVLTIAMMLVLSLALAGCNKAELASLRETLNKTESERDDLKAQVKAVTHKRDQLQKQLDELAGLRDDLKAQSNELTRSNADLESRVANLTLARESLENQVKELADQAEGLIRSRDAALAEAAKAKSRVDALAAQLDGETQKVRVLEGQLKQVQSAIAELQKKFSL